MRAISVLTLSIGLLVGLAAASAQPRQIIILRHGEKMDGPDLCATGFLRAKALADVFLGKGAQNPLFCADLPAAFYTITGHTRETIAPSAASWGLKPLPLSNDKQKSLDDDDKEERENQKTQEAAKDVLDNSDFDDKIVVMTWEHNHIANKGLEKKFPEERVTLRQLLKLDHYAADHPAEIIPETWSGENYDFFWIVDYDDPQSKKPTKVTILKQTFPAPYQSIPANDWGKPQPPLEGYKQKVLAQ